MLEVSRLSPKAEILRFRECPDPSLRGDGEGSHPPGGEGRLLAALDVDGAELLHAAQASGRQVGVGQVCGLLTAAGAAGGCEAGVAGQRRTSRGRVVLHRTFHAVLLKHLLVYELVVLWEAESEGVGGDGGRGRSPPHSVWLPGSVLAVRDGLPAARSPDRHPGGVTSLRHQMKKGRELYGQPWPSRRKAGTGVVQSGGDVHSSYSFEL